MGKISKILYETCDNYSIDEAADSYFFLNIAGINDDIDISFEAISEKEVRVKNSTIGSGLRDIGISSPVSTGTSFLAISSIKNKPVVLVEI